jgi:hypothetical protein
LAQLFPIFRAVINLPLDSPDFFFTSEALISDVSGGSGSLLLSSSVGFVLTFDRCVAMVFRLLFEF